MGEFSKSFHFGISDFWHFANFATSGDGEFGGGFGQNAGMRDRERRRRKRNERETTGICPAGNSCTARGRKFKCSGWDGEWPRNDARERSWGWGADCESG